MEFDLWNEDFQLATEWGLEVPVPHTDGQFGDLKSTGRLIGDDALCFQPQGTLLKEESHEDEWLESSEWMESSDLGSFLDALGETERLLPLEATLLDLNQEERLIKSEFDHYVSPPDSPEQVTPVIQLQTVETTPGNMTVISPESLVMGSTLVSSEDFTFTDLDFMSFKADNISSITDADNIRSPLSVDDVESTISFSGPSSPDTSSQSNFESSPETLSVVSLPQASTHRSIIESSPELYKVISTSSINSKHSSSPYARPSPKQSARKCDTPKAPRKRKSPAQPVPEHVIMEHLDKRDRKKLQNKNAAIRYRMKKKEEAQGIKGEEQELEDINSNLKTKVEDLQREIKYMRNLMEEVCKAKGVKLL
jgi:hypothetical protein